MRCPFLSLHLSNYITYSPAVTLAVSELSISTGLYRSLELEGIFLLAWLLLDSFLGKGLNVSQTWASELIGEYDVNIWVWNLSSEVLIQWILKSSGHLPTHADAQWNLSSAILISSEFWELLPHVAILHIHSPIHSFKRHIELLLYAQACHSPGDIKIVTKYWDIKNWVGNKMQQVQLQAGGTSLCS